MEGNKLVALERTLAAVQCQKEYLFLQKQASQSPSQRKDIEENMQWYEERVKEASPGIEAIADVKKLEEIAASVRRQQRAINGQQRKETMSMPYGPEHRTVKYGVEEEDETEEGLFDLFTDVPEQNEPDPPTSSSNNLNPTPLSQNK